MHKVLPAIVLLGLTVVNAGGCGTIANLASDDPEVFGSLAHDPLLHAADGPPFGTGLNSEGIHAGGKGAVVLLACIIVLAPAVVVTDLSLDIVGDAVTVPAAIYVNRKAHAEDFILHPATPPDPQPEKPLVLPTCLLENRAAATSPSCEFFGQQSNAESQPLVFSLSDRLFTPPPFWLRPED